MNSSDRNMSRLQTAYLPQRLTVRNFLQFEETYVRLSKYERVWEFVDPSTRTEPQEPRRPEILDEGGVPKPTSRVTEHDLHRLDQWHTESRHQVVMWNAQRNRMSSIMNKMLRDLSTEQRGWVQHLNNPRQILIELGRRLRPYSFQQQRQYLYDDYIAICAGPGNQNPDVWLQDWTLMHHLFLRYGMTEVIEDRMPIDFLHAALPLLPDWVLAYHAAKHVRYKWVFEQVFRDFETNWMASRGSQMVLAGQSMYDGFG